MIPGTEFGLSGSGAPGNGLLISTPSTVSNRWVPDNFGVKTETRYPSFAAALAKVGRHT
jgi:hypothetical protein